MVLPKGGLGGFADMATVIGRARSRTIDAACGIWSIVYMRDVTDLTVTVWCIWMYMVTGGRGAEV